MYELFIYEIMFLLLGYVILFIAGIRRADQGYLGHNYVAIYLNI